jgi:hypothetical protein
MTNRVKIQPFEVLGTTGQVWVRDTTSPNGGAWQPVSGAGSVTNVTAEAPFLASSGGATPDISFDEDLLYSVVEMIS